MKTVEIKVTIDPTNDNQLIAAMNLLRTLGKNGSSYSVEDQTAMFPIKETEDEPEKTEEKPKAKRKPAKKKKKEMPDEEPEKVEDTPDSSDVTIDDVRDALAEKVGKHRQEIKAKLSDLGAKNVTSLHEAKYGVFMTFLNSL